MNIHLCSERRLSSTGSPWESKTQLEKRITKKLQRRLGWWWQSIYIKYGKDNDGDDQDDGDDQNDSDDHSEQWGPCCQRGGVDEHQ